ncbi:MAG TPA: hypothetical protein VKB81_02730 [Nitrospira sp.]|nr:hypothetical protein [Nitrospira sp.]
MSVITKAVALNRASDVAAAITYGHVRTWLIDGIEVLLESDLAKALLKWRKRRKSSGPPKDSFRES